MATKDLNVTRIRELAGCTRQCLLAHEYQVLSLAWRFRHNGVSFSHAVDVDDVFAIQAGASSIEHMLTLWCKEHHAGRDGHEIPMKDDHGNTITLLVPEAVD